MHATCNLFNISNIGFLFLYPWLCIVLLNLNTSKFLIPFMFINIDLPIMYDSNFMSVFCLGNFCVFQELLPIHLSMLTHAMKMTMLSAHSGVASKASFYYEQYNYKFVCVS